MFLVIGLTVLAVLYLNANRIVDAAYRGSGYVLEVVR